MRPKLSPFGRHKNVRSSAYDSNGPEGKLRGTASQLAEKYMMMGKDRASSGDLIRAESFFQHAEHYRRISEASGEESKHNNLGRMNSEPKKTHTPFLSRIKKASQNEEDVSKIEENGSSKAPLGASETDPESAMDQEPVKQVVKKRKIPVRRKKVMSPVE